MSNVSGPSSSSPRNRYLTAVLTAVLGVLLGGGIFGYCLMTAFEKLPEPDTEFAASKPTAVSLDRAGEWAIYADSAVATPQRQRCEVSIPDGGTLPITRPTTSVEIGRGGHQWRRVASFTTDAAGAHTITCVSGDGASLFAVGERPDPAGFGLRLAIGIGSLVVLTLGGVLAGVVLIVVQIRRGTAARPQPLAPPGPLA